MRSKIGVIAGILLSTIGCTHPFDNEITENTPSGNILALGQIISEKYCFVEDKNINWDSICEVYLVKAQELDQKDNIGLFDMMEEMVNQLHDGHVNIYTPFDISSSNEWYAGYPDNYDSELTATYLKDARRAGGLKYTKIGDNKDIGYVVYSSFSDACNSSNVYYVLTALNDCRGMILDVRHNGGGDLTNAYRLASTFINQDTLVGYWQHKSGPGRQDYSSMEPIYLRRDAMRNKWLRPVVVLQDRRSYSATNSFCNCMRYAPNATLLGGITGGGGGMPLSYELPIGWTIRFSSIKMYDADKQSIEEGIAPNVYDTLRSKTQDDLIEHGIKIIDDYYKNKQ